MITFSLNKGKQENAMDPFGSPYVRPCNFTVCNIKIIHLNIPPEYILITSTEFYKIVSQNKS